MQLRIRHAAPHLRQRHPADGEAEVAEELVVAREDFFGVFTSLKATSMALAIDGLSRKASLKLMRSVPFSPSVTDSEIARAV